MKILANIIIPVVAIGGSVLIQVYASQAFVNGFVVTFVLLHAFEPIKKAIK